MSKPPTTALALFSGGLDSILACRLVAAQGITVKAIKFVTPFFGYDLLDRAAEYTRETKKKYGIDVRLQDISKRYLELLRNPPHGFGKNFNPCVDCKILLAYEARRMLSACEASFIITGEILGQRPMSQRHDTLRVIERDSGCDSILLRPLCARLMKPTAPEINGTIDREQLLGFSGRGRTPQIEMAKRLGIKDFPTPAGGCLLTDPILGARIKEYYQTHNNIRTTDILLLLKGRQFKLPHGGWLILGRNEQDNKQIKDLYIKADQTGDKLLKPLNRPGPTAVLRFAPDPADLRLSAGLVARYCKKNAGGSTEVTVQVRTGTTSSTIVVPPLEDYGLIPAS